MILGDTITRIFYTRNPNKVAVDADSTPVGTLIRNAVDTTETVTITPTGVTGEYAAVMTIPDTWDEGDSIHLRLEATVGGVPLVDTVFLGYIECCDEDDVVGGGSITGGATLGESCNALISPLPGETINPYKARSAPSSVSSLRMKVRLAVGDMAFDGGAPICGQERYTDDMIDQSLIYTMSEMHTYLGEDPGSQVSTLDMTYTADSRSVDLPSTILGNPIYTVQLHTDGTTSQRYHRVLRRVDYHEFERLEYSHEFVWTLKDCAIGIRPVPDEDLTVEISYMSNPFTIAGATTDMTHAMPVAFEELLVMGAAIRLQEIDDVVPVVRLQRYAHLWEEFKKYALRYRGPIYPVSKRRYKS